MRRALLSPPGGAGGGPVDPTHDPVFDLYSEAMPHPLQVQTRIVRVGPARDITSVAAGVTAATEIRTAGQWAVVVVDAGTYNEQVGVVDNIALVGATGEPADVVIEWASPTGYSPINTYGGPHYVAGITSRLLPYEGTRGGSGVYALHHATNALSVFERMVFEIDEPNQFLMGMDGGARSVTWFIDCVLEANGHGGGTNMHGDHAATRPLRLVYDGCTAPEGVNYNSLGNGQPDQLYVSGGDVDVVTITGATVKATIDPAVATVHNDTGATLVRSSTLPSRPVHGTA